MLENNNSQIKVGAILTYAQMILSVIVSIFYTRIMVKALGNSEYGLYNTVTSTISMLLILSLGFSSSYIRYYAKYKHQADEKEKIAKLNGLFLLIFVVLGTIACLCGLFLTFNLHLVFSTGLTESEYALAKTLMILLTVNLTISFPMSVFANIIAAHEKFILLKSLNILRSVFTPLIAMALLLLGYRSVAIVITTLAVSVFVDVVYMVYCFTKLKTRFSFFGFEKGLLKDLFIFTGFIAINIVVDQINMNMDKVLLGRFKGTQVVAVYAIGNSLYIYYQQISASISTLFTPKVHFIVNTFTGEEQREKLTDIFTKVARVQFLLLGLVFTGFVFFGRSFLNFWVGAGYEDAYWVMILLAFPAIVPLTQNVGIEVQRAENNHRFRSIVYLIMALSNFVLTIFLAQLYGAIGATVGTCISLILANGIIINIYYHKKCNINIFAYWKNIGQMCLGLIIPAICGVLLMRFLPKGNIMLFFAGIVVYTCIYCLSVWFMAMNAYEKDLVKRTLSKVTSPFKKIFSKKHEKND